MSFGDQNGEATAARVFRITLVSSVVLGIEWSIANPSAVAASTDLGPLPWALLALLVPVALGAWAFEMTAAGRGSRFHPDYLWGVLLGTLCYVVVSLLRRYG